MEISTVSEITIVHKKGKYGSWGGRTIRLCRQKKPESKNAIFWNKLKKVKFKFFYFFSEIVDPQEKYEIEKWPGEGCFQVLGSKKFLHRQ